MKQVAILTLATVGASASMFNKRQLFDAPSQSESPEEEFNRHVSEICLPHNSTGDADLNAPCMALNVIQYSCMYGPSVLNPSESSLQDDEEPALLPNETQRACICQSQHNDLLSGCIACYREHGSTELEIQVPEDKIKSTMDAYCDANEPATQAYNMVLFSMYPEDEEDSSSTASASSTAPATFSDPIGNATDVSLYFTPSVTGTAAYEVVVPTSGANATYTSVSTSDGQIVPTAGASEQGSESEESGSASSTESDSGAVQTAMAQVGAMGAAGIAALMAAL